MTQYVSKKFKSEEKTRQVARDAKYLEEMSAKEINDGIKDMMTILPNLKIFIAPPLNVIHGIQIKVGDLNLKEVTVSEYGMW